MNGRASARIRSRHVTPQLLPYDPVSTTPTVSPRRSRRNIRGQSRDVSDAESAPGSIQRRGRGASRESPRSQTRQTRRGKGTIRLRELPTVVEDPTGIIPTVDNRLESAEERAAVILMEPGETSSPGAYSGNTTRTSHSALELADMDSEQMVHNLPELSEASFKIVDLLAPRDASPATIHEITRGLKDKESETSRKLYEYQKVFEKCREKYGSASHINLDIAMRGIFHSQRFADIGHGPWRPDEILFQANLTTALIDMQFRRSDGENPPSLVAKLDRDFPEPFLARLTSSPSALPDGSSAMLKETFDLALEIRTQYFILTVHKQIRKPNFDPDQALVQIFFLDNDLKGFEVDGLRQHEFKKRHIDAISQRIASLRATFGEGRSVDVAALDAAYPTTTFCDQFVLWTRQRVDEIAASLNRLGGADNLQKALKNEIGRRNTKSRDMSGQEGSVPLDLSPAYDLGHYSSDHSEPISLSENKSVPTSLRDSFGTAAAIEHFKQRKTAFRASTGQIALRKSTPTDFNNVASIRHLLARKAAASTPTNVLSTSLLPVPTVTVTRPETRVDGAHGSTEDLAFHIKPQVDEEGWPPPQPHLPEWVVERIVDIYRHKEAEQEKENWPEPVRAPNQALTTKRFLDPQPGAQRIPFDESQPMTSTARRAGLRQRQPLGNASSDAEEEMPDPTQDEGFETIDDTNLQRAPRYSDKRTAPVIPNQRPAKVPLLIPQSLHKSHLNYIESVSRDEPDAAAAELRPSQILRKVKETAQAKEIQVIASKARPPQKRTAWSDEENDYLIEYIGKYGARWAFIKQMDAATDNVLESRDQVALKDRARNIKFIFLRAGTELPRNFEFVALKASQVDALGMVGIAVTPLHRVRRLG